jgi:leader peptidase (prepilin peptidase)/N-methyltransferase
VGDLVYLVAIPVGLLVGGFVTMVIDRAPDRTAMSVRSRCPHCETPLRFVDTIPVVSWFLLRRRCRHCGVPVTGAYPLVELATALLFVAVFVQFEIGWELVPPLVLVTSLMALSVIDLYVYRLPDVVMAPAIVISLVSMVVSSIALDRNGAIPRAIVGALLYFGILLLAHLISPRGMGFGDVKLAFLLGLHLGWVGGALYLGWSPVFRLVMYALFLGSVIGVVVGMLLAILRRAFGWKILPDPEASGQQPRRLLAQSFPFGPALAAGTLVAVLFSDTLLGV